MKKLSIVVPCYNEKESIPIFYKETIGHLSQIDIDYEFIFVNDGSKDSTITELNNLYELDQEHVVVIDLSRNFGKEAAMLAGLVESSGDYVVIMDADLQDPPHLLKEMVETLEGGEYDSVASRRVNRAGEPPIRSFFARQFYKLINRMSDIEIIDGARDYRMMSRQMVDSILELKEYHRFSKGIFSWVGYRTQLIEFENVERIAGETSWNFWGLVKYAIDGIVCFTTVPLRMATIAGVITSIFAISFSIFIAIKKMIYGDPVVGYPSTIALISLIGGIQLVSLGIMGEYISKTYLESKSRPHFFIKDKRKK